MSLYSSWSSPRVKVMIIPNNQIMIVLQTSASDLDTGEINLETVTAMGTEIAIEIISPKFKRNKRVLAQICYQYTLIF